MNFGQRHTHPDIGDSQVFSQTTGELLLTSTRTPSGRPVAAPSDGLRIHSVVPTQTSLFGSFVGVERDPQLT